MTVDLIEEFDDATGRFVSYDTYDPDQALQLRAQQHVDIRSFAAAHVATLTMFELDHLSMSLLDGDTMTALEGSVTLIDEAWTAGSVGVRTTRNYWTGLALTLAAGTNTTESVMTGSPVDISALASTDVISLALGNYPLASITAASSFIDFTSNADGDFAQGPTDSIAFTATTVPLIAGDSELRFPISLLATINLANITGVRFRVQATGVATFLCLAIRALASTWVFAPTDTNTLYNRVVRPVSLTGAAATASAFPSSTWPIIWFADSPPGVADPRPIDLKTSIVFNTGSMVNVGSSDVALCFREIGLDENTQNDLTDVYTQDDLNNYGTELETDGSTVIWTTATLPGRRVQPDFGRALYRPREQSDIDVWTQADLNADTQFMIEHAEDTSSSAYLEVKLTWTNAAASVTVKNADAVGYTFTGITLVAATNYALFADLVDDSIRVRIYALDSKGYIVSLTYDTATIVDDALVHRHKGRCGWHAKLLDGNAYVQAIRPREANFSEYVSLPFYSDTPVMGARLITHSSPDIELITSLTGEGAEVTLDSSKSDSGHAYKVKVDGTTLQGVQTNTFCIDNFDETEVEFDINYPTATLAAGVKVLALLLGEFGRVIELPMPPLVGNHWEHVKIALGAQTDLFQTGSYQLLLLQTGNIKSEWYLDHLSCHTRIVGWDGRGQPTDAWGMTESDWLPFLDAINDPNAGLVFSARGDGMQVRARALRQSATITNITVQPKYAELGRFVWANTDTTVNTAKPLEPTPEISFTTSPEGAAYAYTAGTTTYTTTSKYTAINTVITFTAAVTMPPGVAADEYRWDFGDGVTALGSVATHTYTDLATSEPSETTSPQAVLRVTDSLGRRWYARKSIYLT